ncbi:hypothetical protein [Paramicrobacterium agarici]|uniref:hypothetical protein n=1 Tax=Paramicrobacterium agarici TaxID=630514 RepID=UPI00114ECA70|nr:hypothetical protein [Microbacterium agarici]TQO21614.1 hypothetical protein FB385_0423 [Microbacterium agarici]
MGEADAVSAVASLRNQLTDIVRELSDAQVPTEPLADYVPPRRVALVFRHDSRLVETARVWRLGVLLIDTGAGLYAAGETTRAVEPGWPQHQATSMEIRREYRGAALRGGFATGTTINITATPIDVTEEGLTDAAGPVFLREGVIRVRWSAHVGDDAAMPIDAYLTERIELLRHPPEGA